MEMICKSLAAEASKPDYCIALEHEENFGAEFNMRSVISHLERLIGLQQNITLRAESPKEMVKALRFHPRYEHLTMRELLQIVRNRAGESNAMSVKLSEKLVPVFSAVLVAEGIGVEVFWH